MIELLLRLLPDVGAAVTWAAVFVAAIVGLFALYVGAALAATLLTRDQAIAKIRYEVLRELLKVFRRDTR